MKTKLSLILLLAFTSSVFAAESKKQSEVADILDVSFQYLFKHNASGIKNKAEVYYIAIETTNPIIELTKRKDPDDAFLKRFKKHKPSIKKLSEKNKNFKSLTFTAGIVDWKTDNEVHVYCSYYEVWLSGANYWYTLKKVDGKWKVIKVDRLSIS